MRSRIKAYKKVRVGDLVPHELNPRVHGDDQRQALRDLLGEIGFARSVLAYELPDGRLKLIDGHLRTSEIDPDEEIEVEILDVTDAEGRKLLLSIDPLAQLADYDDHALEDLRAITESDSARSAAFPKKQSHFLHCGDLRRSVTISVLMICRRPIVKGGEVFFLIVRPRQQGSSADVQGDIRGTSFLSPLFIVHLLFRIGADVGGKGKTSAIVP